MKLLSSLLLVPLVGARVVRQSPSQSPSQSQSQSQSQTPIEIKEEVAPGIGIHLTTSYAIAAIRHGDGEVQDLTRLQADDEYIDLMTRWSNPDYRRKCDTKWEQLQCSIARTKRYWNKRLGKPATPDVQVLATFLQQIKASAEKELGADVTDVFPVFPILVALEEDDIQDSLEYAGLTWLNADRQLGHVSYETNAAFAGLGYGLCKSWRNALECAKEEKLRHFEHVLFLNFDNSSFGATLQYMQNAYQEYVYSQSLDLDLGWWELPVYEVPRAKFWAKMHETVLDVGSALQRPPNKVILLGEHAGDKEFVEVVKAALWDLLEYDASMLLEINAGVDSKTIAARGAAELAGRAEYWKDRTPSRTEQETIEL